MNRSGLKTTDYEFTISILAATRIALENTNNPETENVRLLRNAVSNLTIAMDMIVRNMEWKS